LYEWQGSRIQRSLKSLEKIGGGDVAQRL